MGREDEAKGGGWKSLSAGVTACKGNVYSTGL